MDEVKITEEDVIDLMDLFTRVPPFLLRGIIKRKSNLVKTFKAQVEEQKNQLSPEELVKIRKVTQMPISELQDMLNKAYEKTGQKQLKMLGEPPAEPFIQENLEELEKVLFMETGTE